MAIRISEKQLSRDDYQVLAVYKFANENREFVGSVSVRYYCLYGMTDMEYAILPAHQNKGYATAAVKLVLKDIFCNKTLDGYTFLNAYGKANRTDCKAVGLQISKDNIASLKVAKSAGFSLKEERTSYVGQITSDTFKRLRIKKAEERGLELC